MKASILAIMLMVSCVGLADTWTDPETGRTWSYRVIGDTAEITQGQYSNWTGDLIIPGNLGGAPVTSIGPGAFSGCRGLASVTIPDSVTSIGDAAFFFCSGLTSVTIPNSVTSIGDYAFSDCSGLTNMTIGSGVTIIGDSAFSCCGGLTSVTMPDSVTSIGSQAFSYCSGLTRVTIPSHVEYIGVAAFAGCGALSCVNLPENIYGIEQETFYGCSSLTSITIPGNVWYIGWYAFSECANLTKLVLLNPDVNIADRAFAGCVGLAENDFLIVNGCLHDYFGTEQSIVIPQGVTRIAESAFRNNELLKYVSIPSSVMSIGDRAFYGCNNLKFDQDSVTGIQKMDGWIIGCDNALLSGQLYLHGIRGVCDIAFAGCTNITSIQFGDGLQSVGEGAFLRCKSLKRVVLPSSLKKIAWDFVWTCEDLESIEIDSNNSYFSSSGSAVCDKSIGSLVFVSRKAATINIPNGVESIASTHYFDGCTNLVSLTLPASVSYLWGKAFLGAVKLQTINVETWNQNYRSIDGIVFNRTGTSIVCVPTARTSIVIPEGVTEIPSDIFQDNTNIVSITLPDSLRTINSYAFYGCTSLSSFNIPSNIWSIGINAFQNTAWWNGQPDGLIVKDNCAIGVKGNLVHVDVPDDCPLLPDGMFRSSNISSIHLPNSITNLPTIFFAWNKSLEAVDLPAGLTKISSQLFDGCSALSSIKIPNGVTTIDSYAFRGCAALKTVALPNSVASIGWGAFAYCSGLKAIVLSENLSKIEGECFRGCSSLQRFILPSMNEHFAVVDGVLYSKDMTRLVCAPAGIEAIDIPDTVVEIAESAFYGCTKLTAIELPPSLKSIGGSAFAECTALTTITIPDEVMDIPYSAFQNCTSITNVFLPDGVYSIGSQAFAGCTNLESINIPAGVEFIYDGAFDGTRYLDDMDDGVIIINGVVLGVKGTCSEEIVLPDGVKQIADNAFEGCPQLVSIKIPEGVASIGYRAFADCNMLQTIELPNGLGWLNSGVFSGCRSLEVVHLPDSLSYLNGDVFEGCSSLTNLNVPASVQEIYNADILAGLPLLVDADACPGLKLIDGWIVGYDEANPPGFIDIPYGIRGLAEGAFSCCPSLISVTVPGSVKRISSNAFSDCPNLLAVEVDDGVEAIAWGAFRGCRNLVSLSMPESIKEVANNMLEGTSLLADSPDGPIVIDGWLLGWNGELQEDIALPGDVRHFPYQFWAVRGKGLRSITIPEGMENIPAFAFAGCKQLECVKVMGVNTTINSFAFLGCQESCRIEMTGEESGRHFSGWLADNGNTDVVVFPEFNFSYYYWYIDGMNLYVGTIGANDGNIDYVNIGEEYLLYPQWRINLWPVEERYNPLVANVYDGYIVDGDGALAGIVQVKAAKQTVKSVTDKVAKVKTATTNVAVTATVTDAAGKKWPYKGVGTVDGVATGLVCTAKGVLVPSFGVSLGANGLEGEWGDFQVTGARNGMGVKGDAMMAMLDENYKKSWSVTLANEQGVTRLQLVVGAKGSTKISGVTPDGFKISATVQGIMGEDAFFVPYLAMLKNGKLTRPANLLLALGKDGTMDARTSNLGALKAGGPTVDEVEVLAYVESESSKGGEAYAGTVVLNDLAYPAKFAAKGLPAGLKIDAATGAITGTPTKPGHYTATITVTSGVNGKKKVETAVDFDIGNYTDDLIKVSDSYGDYCVGVMVQEPIAAAIGCTVSGLPAGLKFAAKETKDKTFGIVPAGTVYGVPTKAGEYTVYFKKSEKVNGKTVNHQASATFRVEPLPVWAQGTFDGCVYFPPSDPTNGVVNTRDIGGTITLTAAAAGKISASVKTAKKTYSFSMASWTKFAEGDAFTLEASDELKTGEVLEINATVRDGATVVFAKLSGGEFGDDGCVTMLVKDVYAKNGAKWIDEEAHGLMAKCAGTYQFGFDAVENEAAWTLRPVAKVEAAFLKVLLKDTGVATITGTLPDKTRMNISAKATASAVVGSDKIEIKILSAAFAGKTITLPVEINLMNDGSFAEGRTNCGIIHSVKR